MLADTVLGYACFLEGRFGEAESALRSSIDTARREGRVQRVASNLSILAQTLALEGRMREANELLAEARGGGAAYGFTILLDMSARIRWLAGDFEGTIGDALEATSWTREDSASGGAGPSPSPPGRRPRPARSRRHGATWRGRRPPARVVNGTPPATTATGRKASWPCTRGTDGQRSSRFTTPVTG
jgi:hypothetical protein